MLRFLNTDLKTLIELHTHNALEKINRHSVSFKGGVQEDDNVGLNTDQRNLIISALELEKITGREIMTEFNKVFMMDYDQPIGEAELKSILEKGFSRIPIYEGFKNNLVGILRIKQLIGINLSKPKSIRELNLILKMPLILDPSMKVYDILGEFRKGKSHMAFLTEGDENVEKLRRVTQSRMTYNRMNSIRVSEFSPKEEEENKVLKNLKIEGMLTLEDVIEDIIKVQILDEDDYEKLRKERPTIIRDSRLCIDFFFLF